MTTRTPGEWKATSRTDAAVARALGKKVVRDLSTSRGWSLNRAGNSGQDLPFYSRDMNAAMAAVQAIRTHGDYFELRATEYWTASLTLDDGTDYSADANTPQLAVCRLVIRFVQATAPD